MKNAGVGIFYRQTLWRDCETENPMLWLDIALPIEYVSTRVQLSEKITSTGGGSDGLTGLDGTTHVGSMTAAFKQAGWKFGRCRARIWLGHTLGAML
jgi:hypothetical protein